MEATLGTFAELFEGNEKTHGTESGGCSHTPPDFIAHLAGTTTPIGVYPMRYLSDDWHVKWGCVDLDVKSDTKRRWDYECTTDAARAAMNLKNVLHTLGIHAFIECTRSKGYHVWIFATTWVPARTMRRALLIACDIAEVPPTEVNPKSETLSNPTAVGNYVRLPYPGTGNPRPMQGYKDISDFITVAWETRSTPALLNRWADIYRPPIKQAITIKEYATDLEVTPLIRSYMNNGPFDPHGDRSAWLYSLCCRCKEQKLDAGTALQVLTYCDNTWTQKFTNRHDGHEQLENCVRRAYA